MREEPQQSRRRWIINTVHVVLTAGALCLAGCGKPDVRPSSDLLTAIQMAVSSPNPTIYRNSKGIPRTGDSSVLISDPSSHLALFMADGTTVYKGGRGAVVLNGEKVYLFHLKITDDELVSHLAHAQPNIAASSHTQGKSKPSGGGLHSDEAGLRVAARDSTHSEMESQYQTYLNEKEGIRIQHPKAWPPSDRTIAGMIVGFVSPRKTATDTFLSNIAITTTDLSNYRLTLDQYMETTVTRLNVTFSGVTVEKAEYLDLCGHPTKMVVMRADGKQRLVIVMYAFMSQVSG